MTDRITDTVTILTSKGRKVACKTHSWTPEGWVTTDFDEAKHYSVDEVYVTDIDDLSALLVQLEREPRRAVIRAVPLPGIPLDRVRRLIYEDPEAKEGERGPFFAPHEEGRTWACIDIDKAPPPPPEVGTEPSAAVVRWAVDTYLPEAFHGVSFHYSWTSSAGFKPWADGLRLHLWFVLAERVCEESWIAWSKGYPLLDVATLRPHQAITTAHPIVVGGIDPVERRSGLIRGERAVVSAKALGLCGAAEWVKREHDRIDIYTEEKALDLSHDLAAEGRLAAWAKRKVEECVREILGLEKGSRNDLTFKIALSVARVAEPAGLDVRQVYQAIEEAAIAVGDNAKQARDTVKRAFAAGSRNPRDLSEVLARLGDRRDRPSPKPRGDAPREGAPEPQPEAAPEPRKVTLDEYFCGPTRRLTVGGRSIIDGELGDQAVPGVPGAPHPDARVPMGYYVAPWATGWHSGDKSGVLLPCPIVIAGRSEDSDSGELQLLIAWRAPDGWHRRLIPRVDALGRGVQSLAAYGLPVTADATKSVNRYLVAYEAENYRTIPTLRTSRGLGWQGEGELGFLIGFRHLTPGRETKVDIERWTSETMAADAVAFQPHDQGDRAIAQAFKTRGKWGAWVDALRAMDAYPKATLAVLASLAATVLEIVGGRGFGIDWSGPSSTGKSIVMRFAASVWGDPVSLVRTWDASDTYLERTLGTLRSLPLFMDETQRLMKGRDPGAVQLVNQALYMVENGHGRGRANLGHSQVTQTWRTIMLSTGEVPATSIGDSKGGANARCVLVQGPPFGRGQHAGLVLLLDDVARSHYGLAGERWIKWLVANRKRWSEWGELHDQLRRDYLEETTSGAESRLAGARAVLEVTRRLAEEALCLRMTDPLRGWSQLTSHADDATGEQRALEELGAWVIANREHFLGSGYTADRAPSGGWLGVMRDDLVAIVPTPLEEWLRRRGHQARAVLEAWRERGWLLVDGDRDGRLTRKVSLGPSGRIRCYALPKKLVLDLEDTTQTGLGAPYH